jgi:peptidoglycan DL-endopeptidase CwlO
MAVQAQRRQQHRRPRWRATLAVSGLVVGSVGALAPAGRAAAAPRTAAVRTEQVALVRLASSATEALRSGSGSLRVRRELAAAVAIAAAVDPAPVVAAWEAASVTELEVALAALSQVGVPYRRLGTAPDQGFDCSGFTSWAWSTVGVELPHSSYEQLALDGHPAEEAHVGDLVGYPGHVELYLGGGVIVHAPTTGRTVEVGPLRKHRDHFVSPVVDDGGAGRNPSVMTRVRAF